MHESCEYGMICRIESDVAKCIQWWRCRLPVYRTNWLLG